MAEVEKNEVIAPKVSILVPIYKVEKYLQRCIDSVLAQTFSDWEMILVDDGSPDKCPEICDNAAVKDRRITVVHKTNGGLISARKAGVQRAKGEYYMFLDSDDWLQPNAIEKLYAQMKEGYDMVRGGAQRVTPNGTILPLESYQIVSGVVDGTEQFLIDMYVGNVAPYLWGALYKASLFEESVFDDSIKAHISLGEDKVTNLIVGLKIRRVLYVKDVIYNYFYNPSSIMSTKAVSSSYGKRLEDLLADKVFCHYPSLQEWQQAKFASYCFRNCFVPDLGFSGEYTHYAPFLKDKRYADKIKQCIEPKFLLFAKWECLFKAYSALYRWVYRILKDNNKKERLT